MVALSRHNVTTCHSARKLIRSLVRFLGKGERSEFNLRSVLNDKMYKLLVKLFLWKDGYVGILGIVQVIMPLLHS